MGKWWPIAAVCAVSLVTACGADGPSATGAGADDGVRIASFDFAESEVIAELYAQMLEATGLPVVRLGAVGPREVVAPALEQGLVDLVPEYLGAASGHFGAEVADVAGLTAALAPRGLVPLAPAPAQDVNVVVVTRLLAADLGLTAISDLAPVADGLTIGGPVECPSRPHCLVGLRDVYGLEFELFAPQRSLAVTAEALRRSEIDVGIMFSTAPEVTESRLLVLDDDRDLQPDEFVIPVARLTAIERWGGRLVDALDRLSRRLTTASLQNMNREVRDGATIEAAAAGWLQAAKLVGV